MVASKNDDIIMIMKTNRLIDDTEDTVPKEKRGEKRLREKQGCKGKKKIFMQLKQENIISWISKLQTT